MRIHPFGFTVASLGAGLVAGAVALALAAAPAAAQHAGHHPAPAIQQGEWTGDLPAHFEGIALTAEQKSRIVALQKEYHGRMQAMRDSVTKGGGKVEGNAELTKAIQGVMAAEHAAFKALLDEAGRKRFDENMAKMHAKPGHGSGHGPGHASGHAGHGGATQPPAGGRPPAH